MSCEHDEDCCLKDGKKGGSCSLKLAARLWRVYSGAWGVGNGEAVTQAPVKAVRFVSLPVGFSPPLGAHVARYRLCRPSLVRG